MPLNKLTVLAAAAALFWQTRPLIAEDQINILRGHESAVVAIEFADEITFSSADAQGNVLLWDPFNPDQPTALPRVASATELEFSPDGAEIAVATSDGVVHVLTVKGEHKRLLRAAAKENISELDFPAGKATVIAVTKGNRLSWDVGSGKATSVPLDQSKLSPPIVLVPSGPYLVGLDENSNLVLWDAQANKKLHNFQSDLFIVPVVLAVSDDKRFLAAVDADHPDQVILWDLATGKQLRTLKAYGGPKSRLLFSKNGEVLVVEAAEGTITMLDVATGEDLSIFDRAGPEGSPIAISPEGTRFAQGLPDGTVQHRERSLSPRFAAEDEREFATVPVYYGTNRQAAEQTVAWTEYFRRFFTTYAAYAAYGVVVGVLAVEILLRALLGRPSRSTLGMTAVAGMVLVLGMASTYAFAGRSAAQAERPGDQFGIGTGPLQLGMCTVTVPARHVLGQLESPPSFWVFRAAADRNAHIILQDVTPVENPDSFYASLRDQIAQTDRKDAFVFIHGYNVTFEDAARRTAQLAVDLGFDGGAVFYSWPSHADPLRYTFDETNAEVSGLKLRDFLADIAAKCGAKKVHLIAHSMGNRVLAKAIQNLDDKLGEKDREVFREIVLAAPDIDRRVFVEEIAPVLSAKHHVTLYASSKDRALLLSKTFHDFQRAGDTLPEIVLAQGIDTIDASAVDTSLLGHSYYGDQKSVVTDILYTIRHEKPPPDRFGLQPVVLTSGNYWIIKP